MALQRSIIFKGIELPAAYTHIRSRNSSRDSNGNLLVCFTYKDAETAAGSGDTSDASGRALEITTHRAPFNSGAIEADYNYLKTLPEFDGALDV